MIHEVAHYGRVNDKHLYRGAAQAPSGLTGWSESRAVANGWAKKNGGQVYTLPKGSGYGVKIADYRTGSGLDEPEREWIIDAERTHL